MRVARHRNKIFNLKFTDKYFTGKEMPCDFASRHPLPIERLSQKEGEKLMVDEGKGIQVMRVVTGDGPGTTCCSGNGLSTWAPAPTTA